MNASIPDINLVGEWKELYSASGISPSTALTIQNKTSNTLRVAVSNTAPTSDKMGYEVSRGGSVLVEAGKTAVWAYGVGPVFVQAATEINPWGAASGGGGGGGGGVPAPYAFKLAGDGSLELTKDNVSIAKHNVGGSWFKDEVTTGVGSFHLGSVHTISSGVENVVFTNENSGICYFPSWAGISKDGSQVLDSTFRNHSSVYEEEPAGARTAGTSVNYEAPISPTVNLALFKETVFPAEAYTGDVVVSLRMVSTSAEIARFTVPVVFAVDVAHTILYGHPVWLKAGQNCTIFVTKPDGTPVKMRAGTAPKDNQPFRKIYYRIFTDNLAYNQGNILSLMQHMSGYSKTLDAAVLKNLPIATNADLGMLKVGAGLSVTADGTVSSQTFAAKKIVVSNQTEMLLGANGDGTPYVNLTIALRTDDLYTYYLGANSDPKVLANWERGAHTGSSVSSFNGRTGTVVPQTGDYTATMVGALSEASIADNLTTDSSTRPLSARMGKLLYDSKVDKIPGWTLCEVNYTGIEKLKLSTIQDSATKNATDVQLRDRTTHTGEQPISSVTGLQTALNSKMNVADMGVYDPLTVYFLGSAAGATEGAKSILSYPSAITLTGDASFTALGGKGERVELTPPAKDKKGAMNFTRAHSQNSSIEFDAIWDEKSSTLRPADGIWVYLYHTDVPEDEKGVGCRDGYRVAFQFWDQEIQLWWGSSKIAGVPVSLDTMYPANTWWKAKVDVLNFGAVGSTQGYIRVTLVSSVGATNVYWFRDNTYRAKVGVRLGIGARTGGESASWAVRNYRVKPLTDIPLV